jgi:BirA family biotin operon repressor/biotin-[acetyl-CoA-carboxylase] ligase
MNDKPLPFTLIHLCETDSTNTYLEKLSAQKQLENFTTVISDFQYQGHGQGSNVWESENDKNLLFSFILYPDFCEANKQFHLSQLVSLAIKETLDQYTGGISIKWPNDIYWRKKKICGILIKNELYGSHIAQSIFGIGVNLNQEIFKGDAPNPVSLSQITGDIYEPKKMLAEIIERAQKLYQLFENHHTDEIVQAYFEALYHKEGFHRYQDKEGEFMAKITDILPVGTLILTDEQGTERRYNFKEVSFVLE